MTIRGSSHILQKNTTEVCRVHILLNVQLHNTFLILCISITEHKIQLNKHTSCCSNTCSSTSSALCSLLVLLMLLQTGRY